MGLFGRRGSEPPVLRPVPTHLNAGWFDAYWDEVIRSSGVDPEDRQNKVQLIEFILKVIDDTAKQMFAHMGDHEAPAAYQAASHEAGPDVRIGPSSSLERRIDGPP